MTSSQIDLKISVSRNVQTSVMAYCDTGTTETTYIYLLPSLTFSVLHQSVQSVFMSQTSKLVSLDISVVSIFIQFVCLSLVNRICQFLTTLRKTLACQHCNIESTLPYLELMPYLELSPGSQSLTVQKLPVIASDVV